MKTPIEIFKKHGAHHYEDKYDDHLVIDAMNEYSNQNNRKLVDALEKLIHLHSCEMEGIGSCMPTPSQWMEAVEQAQQTLNEINK